MVRAETFFPWIDWSRRFLAIGFVLGLLLILILAWKAPTVLFFVPALIVGGVVVWFIFKNPALNLILLLSFFVFESDYEEGLQLSEVIYGLYFFVFMAHWLLRHWMNGEKIIETKLDAIFTTFLFWIILSFFQTLLFNGQLRVYFSEMIALAFFSLYFPVKEICVKHPNGSLICISVIVFQGFYAALRNISNYRELIVSAQFEWQLELGRVVTNEQLLLVPAFICLILFLFESRIKRKYVYLGGFLLFLGSLVLTQSRAYWVDFAFGSFVLFWFLNWKQKTQLFITSTVALSFLILTGILFFGDLFYNVIEGLIDRLLSLGTATTSDISLINRFMESNAVWEKVIRNPIIGYGTGVSYAVYDITFGFTQVDTYVHNGFIGVWYKFGIIGLFLLLYVWIKTIAGLFTLWYERKKEEIYTFERLVILMFFVALISLAPSTSTSNPFFLKDAIMTFGVLFGGGAGVIQKFKNG